MNSAATNFILGKVLDYTRFAGLESGGTYCIINFKGETVVDLSGGDNKSIIGWTKHKGSNQVWLFEKKDDRWLIKNAASNKYLSVEGDVRDGAKVIASTEPFWWTIRLGDSPPADRLVQITVPDTKHVLDLSDHGNATPGTPITLWSKSSGHNQIWHFEKA